ncbi:hypothetical protein NST84_24285 [Paenibacillus sp. FSL R7-0345]
MNKLIHNKYIIAFLIILLIILSFLLPVKANILGIGPELTDHWYTSQ